MKENFEKVLSHYGISGKVVDIHNGPVVRLVEFEPEVGTKFKNVVAVMNDVARELGVPSLRVDVVEDTNNLGFEFPAENPKTIDFVTILQSEEFKNEKAELPICLGVDIKGKPVFANLAKMPHLLVAGTTGSGKSVGLNSFIMSLIAKKTPNELKLVMIDPKRIEFGLYNNQQYLLYPVVTENNLAVKILQKLVEEMETRYSLMEESLTRNIADYNKKGGALPYIVCIIDEFADLVAADKNAALAIQRLAQKSRAAGIHIILATQRPSVDVVNGVLKANLPYRLAYKVASIVDSRTILDMAGAEDLLGRGDALFKSADGSLQRVHGAYVADTKINEMLQPFRCKVKECVIDNEPNAEEKTPEKKSEENVGFFRKCLNAWSNLKQKEKKTIISAVIFLIGWLLGKNTGASVKKTTKNSTRKKRK